MDLLDVEVPLLDTRRFEPVLTAEEGLDLPYSFEAMAEAGQTIKQMFIHVARSALNIAGMIPGPIGVIANGVNVLLAYSVDGK